ncbi:MAG: SGNH/GDSL hydrolase family protein [Clostridia bacterium]|nr:SGNH/GDSL hydrolase family protein [Clostridia bacterium]
MSEQVERIEKIDKAMAVEATVTEPDIVFYDIRRAPFAVYGLYNYRTEPDFKRMPDEVAQTVSKGVAGLAYHTAGGRVRFSSDSAYVAIRAEMPKIGRMPHFALTGSSAFDLYVDDPETGITRFYKEFRPAFDFTGGYESIVRFGEKKLRHFTVHFPSYSRVRNLRIGLQQDATVGEGMKYRNDKPVVYYGSSITQGGCASRPGNSYQNVIAQRLGLDYINLGFSGSGKGEPEIAEYMASLDMMAFICDYDANAPTVEHLRGTHLPLYQKIRAKHPDIPYIMISRVHVDRNYADTLERRDVIIDTYRYAREQGDRNVYFIDGESVFRGKYANMCTVDGVHPNDLGFALMADAIGATLERAMTQHLV